MSEGKQHLDTDDLSPDPIEQFSQWYSQAEQAGQPEPEVCCLATATPDGRPSARIVLLRGFDRNGFVFYTNYGSRKANELEANPFCALTFHWPQAGWQVRIEGKAKRTSREESEEYFNSRPYESRLGAWASRQSSPLATRDELVSEFEVLREKYHDHQNVPLPDFWGGYRIVPTTMEFWQQGPWRLHDRFIYKFQNNRWDLHRLAP